MLVLKVHFLKRFFVFLLLERGEGREKEMERNINVWLPLLHPLLGTWPTNQARALTGNRASNPFVLRPSLRPLSQTHQGSKVHFLIDFYTVVMYSEVFQLLGQIGLNTWFLKINAKKIVLN